MAPSTHNVKKIKGAAHKESDIDGSRKQAFAFAKQVTRERSFCVIDLFIRTGQ